MPDDDDTIDIYPPIDPDDLGNVIAGQLSAFIEQSGRSIQADVAAVGAYAAERAAHLATLAGQPGFEDAALAERDNVALKAGIAAASRGDATDQRLIGIIQGTLRTAALILAA